MPQMSPMWWTTLFFMFIMTYMIMTMMNYFFKIKKSTVKTESSKIMVKKMNWKW